MNSSAYDIKNFSPRLFLTRQGKEKVRNYIAFLNEMQREIIGAGKDTANDTTIPTEEDIDDDLKEFVDASMAYKHCWNATGHYEYPLRLTPADYRITVGSFAV